jgi:hypothetical protein
MASTCLHARSCVTWHLKNFYDSASFLDLQFRKSHLYRLSLYFIFFIFSQLKFLPFDYPNHMKYFLHNYLSRYVHANQSRNILVDANVLEPNSAVDDWLKHDETPVLATFFSLLWRDLSFCSGPYFFIPGMKERLYIKPSGSLPSDRQVQFYI